MMRRRATLPALALLTALLLSACADDQAGGGGERAARPVSVTSTVVQPVAWRDSIEALGTARANESLVLTSKVTETVDAVKFEDGDQVSAGDVLVDLSGRAEVAALEEAQAAYKEARQQYERQAELVGQGTIARSQLDTQVAARDATKARVEAIRARLSDRVITAPFDGVLGFRQVSPGTLITPGTAIATLDDISTIKLDFSVPERFLSTVTPGQQVTALSAAWPEREFQGVVTTIGSRVDPVTRAVPVRAELPNDDGLLRPGMLLTVRLFEAPRQTLAIPEIALTQVGSQAFVYRIGPDGTVQQADVEIGARRRGEVEIVAGLQPGERIVVDGPVTLRPGAKVVDVGSGAADAPATASP